MSDTKAAANTKAEKQIAVWFPGNCPITDAAGHRCMKSIAGGSCVVHGDVSAQAAQYRATGVLPVAS